MRLLFAYGTRPEWIKIKPLIAELEKAKNIPYEILFTGQQAHIGVGEFTKQLKIEDGSNRLDSIVRSLLNDNWIFHDITHVIVQGDTSSAFGIALAAFHRQIKVIHLEAGLRTYNYNPFPEEANRRMIDSISDIFLCPTITNKNNLMNEGHDQDKIFVTGNTGLDDMPKEKIGWDDFVLVTMHRRENHELMKEWFEQINLLTIENRGKLKFILPLHPNPNVTKYRDVLPDVHVINPLPYHDIIHHIARCKFIVSDSGGIQEEASWYGKKIIVCRGVTERPETLNIHSFLCPHPRNLKLIFNVVKNNPIPAHPHCPYGDGIASKRIVQILQELYNAKAE